MPTPCHTEFSTSLAQQYAQLILSMASASPYRTESFSIPAFLTGVIAAPLLESSYRLSCAVWLPRYEIMRGEVKVILLPLTPFAAISLISLIGRFGRLYVPAVTASAPSSPQLLQAGL